jgi:pentatricopeptide repeat protein
MSKLSKEGSYRKALEIFDVLPRLGITYDTTITNAAISACDKGEPPPRPPP